MRNFYSLHPAVSAIYFLSILLITMFTANPILLLFSLLGGIAFCAVIENARAFRKSLVFYLPLFLLISLTNPLFSHNGATPIFFFNGNPVTLEAVLYGIDIAAMLLAVMYWFKCFNHIMTSDKLLFLFGKASPKISLVLSSALRFIPLFKSQAERIRQTQKAMGLFSSDSWMCKLRETIRVFSSLITWSLENAIDTGSSMKGRGYGLKGMSHFALFKFTFADMIMAVIIIILDSIVIVTMAGGKLGFDFYPKVTVMTFEISTIPAFTSFGLLALLPFILEVKENIQWKYYKSKI